MTALRLVPGVRARSLREERANRLALMTRSLDLSESGTFE